MGSGGGALPLVQRAERKGYSTSERGVYEIKKRERRVYATSTLDYIFILLSDS
jgi:hypothetical protein